MTAQTAPAHISDREITDPRQYLCDRHNAMPGSLQDYDCPVCKNKGWIYRLADGAEVARRCPCMDVRESIRRMKRSGLYNKLNVQTFDAFHAVEPWQQTLLRKAKQYAERHDRPGFFLGGQQGSGKTHLCTAVCAALLRQGLAVQYFVWETDVKEILNRSGISDREEHDRRMRPLLESAVLYLDDFLRKPNPTQSERSVAFDVINRRYNDGKITLVTSEHSIDELMNTDEAVASRIREMCGAAYCMSIAPDRRKNYRLHGKP